MNDINLDSIDLQEEASAVLDGGIIVDEDGQKTINLGGDIEADPVIPVNPKWGKIIGDINQQLDLIGLFDEKENNQSKKVADFFEAHSEFNNTYLKTIENKNLTEVRDYIQLIVDYKLANDELWVPYESDKMALIVKCNATKYSELIRFYLPYLGDIITVSIDEDIVVCFSHHYIGDDIGKVIEWGTITGSIQNQADLIEILNEKVNYSDECSSEDIRNLFE